MMTSKIKNMDTLVVLFDEDMVYGVINAQDNITLKDKIKKILFPIRQEIKDIKLPNPELIISKDQQEITVTYFDDEFTGVDGDDMMETFFIQLVNVI